MANMSIIALKVQWSLSLLSFLDILVIVRVLLYINNNNSINIY